MHKSIEMFIFPLRRPAKRAGPGNRDPVLLKPQLLQRKERGLPEKLLWAREVVT
jgi:hypothetical protein